jgi:hypothetical protein
MDWFKQSSPLIVSVVPRLSLGYLLEAGFADCARVHDLSLQSTSRLVLEVCEDPQSLQGLSDILSGPGVFPRKTRLALSYLLEYPFQEFWSVEFQEFDEALYWVLLVESV